MANLAQGTSIGSGGLNGSYGAANTMRLGIFNYREAQEVHTSRFLHFKTNVSTGGVHRMVMIEAVGYDYAGARPIHCSWGFYVYQNGLVNISLQNLYNGMIPNAVYKSSDEFVCISAAARDLYFVGVTLNSYTVNNSWGRGLDVQITAAGTTTSAGNFY